MLYSLLSIFAIFVKLTVSSGEDEHGHSDCSCTTGITTAMLDLNCDDDGFDTTLGNLQSYLVDNKCDQYCINDAYPDETAFRCLQVWTLLSQYHAYCVSGTVNETLFHEYLEVCPDCEQDHFQYPNAQDCDTTLNCTDASAQITAVNYVLANCIDDESCTDPCPETFREVEAYHRVCDHDDITEEFDEAFDKDPWSNTLCQVSDIHCNVPEEANHTANCSAEANMEFNELREMYGNLTDDVLDDLFDESKGGMIASVVYIAFVAVLGVILN